MRKTCFKCQVEQDVDAFYRHPAMADGRLGKCKTCTKADANKHRDENIDRIRAYDRERGQLAHRKAANTARRSKIDKAIVRAYHAKYNGANKQKRRATVIVSRALKAGKITRTPCSCGNPKVEAHHDDYSQPLQVRWLCRQCHGAEHRRINETRRRRAV